MGSWPSARHDQAQWLGTDKARAVVVARSRLWGPWAWYKALFGFKGWASKEICWRCKANCSDILWTGRTRLEICLSSGSQATVGHKMLSISCMCVCACVLVCVCSSVLRVHVQVCVVSPAGPGPFRAQSRSAGIAKLWIRIKLHHKAFHTQSWLESLTWEMIPRRPDASQAACEGCGDPPLGALRFRTGDGLPQAPAVSSQPHSPWTLRAAVRLVHDHVCGAVRQCCVRQVLSPILQLLQGFVQGCLQRQLVGAGAEDAQWSRRCARCSLSCSATRANSGPTRTRASWAWFRPWRTRAVDRRRLRQFLSVCWTHIARSRVDGRL